MVGVSRRFGDVTALDDISMIVQPGRIVGVIGPSGAGKTTAIRLLTGVLRPSEGTIRILGGDPTTLSSRTRERIGLMPQHSTLYEDLTTFENLDFVGSLFGLLYPRRRRRMRETLIEPRPLGCAAPTRRRPVGRHAAPVAAGNRAGP